MNTKQLTDLVEVQAAMIEQLAARIAELEQARVGMRGWAEKVQAHLTYKPAAKKQSEWVSGYRPNRAVRRPEAPAAAAAEPASSGIEWKDLPVEPLDDPTCNPSPIVDEDCPF